jgi:hypothetical protein
MEILIPFYGKSACYKLPLARAGNYLAEQPSTTLISLQWMQETSKSRYTLFLQSGCGYACVDREMPAFESEADAALLPGRGQRLARPDPLSASVSERAVVEVPADIDPLTIAAHEHLSASTGVEAALALVGHFEDVGVVKDRRVAEQLDFGASGAGSRGCSAARAASAAPRMRIIASEKRIDAFILVSPRGAAA